MYQPPAWALILPSTAVAVVGVVSIREYSEKVVKSSRASFISLREACSSGLSTAAVVVAVTLALSPFVSLPSFLLLSVEFGLVLSVVAVVEENNITN